MSVTARREDKFAAAPAKGRSTDELLKLIESSSDIRDAMAQMEGDIAEKPFRQMLLELMDRQGVDAVWVAEHAIMSRVFVYQLCSGKRGPGRDIVLRLALLLKAGIPDAQRMLCAAGRGALYPRVRRDAILLYALKEEMTVFDTDDLLQQLGEEPLIQA